MAGTAALLAPKNSKEILRFCLQQVRNASPEAFGRMIIIQRGSRAVLLMRAMSKYHDALRAFATCGRARALTWLRTQ
jgi:hypothetical protein